MNGNGQQLFNLLPALYRVKDRQLAQSLNLPTTTEIPQGPLESLLMVISEQLQIIAQDLNQLYDDQFIETCAPWVISYIGDLIGYQPVNGVAPSVGSPRAEVAHTIAFRRRKGTILVLEQLARDVTGWGAHAAEFFKFLTTTQYMKHIRPDNLGTPDLRDWKPGEYLGTAFDTTAHNVDLRRIAVERGRYNIQNVGILLWTLNAYSLTKSPCSPSPANTVEGSAQCFRFSPLGADMPLFNNPITQGANITVAAQPINVPDRLPRRVLCEDIQSGAAASYYGESKSLGLYLNGTFVNPYQIQVCDLSGADGEWANLPAKGSPYAAAIDPKLGRIALPPSAATPQVSASFYYGFSGDMGGGEYPRADSFALPDEPFVVLVPDTYPTVHAALNALAGQGVVEITDSGSYSEPSGLTVNVNAHGRIEIRAADECRPTLALGAEITVTGGADSRCDINGLVITYPPTVSSSPLPTALIHVTGTGNELIYLGLTHCTLVPGWSLTAEGDPEYSNEPGVVVEASGMQLVVQKSICGGIRVQDVATATISDSMVDASAPTNPAYASLDGTGTGGSLTLQSCTVIGKLHAKVLNLSDSMVRAQLAPADTWKAALWADLKQQGCVKFSYLPSGSVTPRQFECVEEGQGSPEPLFSSLRYGDPDYGKLLPGTDDAIRRGAQDGGEMGAFHFLLSPLRETDLLVRMREYLPVGLEFGVFYAT